MSTTMMRRQVTSLALSLTARSKLTRMLSTAMLDDSIATNNNLYESCDDYEILDVHQYLSEVEDKVKPRQMRLNETHRKCMLRTLTGMNDLDDQVRKLKVRLQWQRAIDFCQNHLLPLKDMRILGAPHFQAGLGYCPHPQKHFRTPIKWLSFMAKGREYQGKFLWLLCDIAPELIADFTNATEVVDDQLAKRIFIESIDFEHKKAAIKCVELVFPKQYSVVNGNAVGKRSESRLSTFLEQRATTSDQHIVIENVLVKPNGKRGSGILVYKGLNSGMTTEFDCMIVEREGDYVRIHEVWEAKASITPVSLYDASVKKASSLKKILEDDSIRFVLDNEVFRLRKEAPLFGLFGSTLHPPGSSAQRINAFACQKLLSESVDAVMESLDSGVVIATKDTMMEEVGILRRVLDRVQPIIAVPRVV